MNVSKLEKPSIYVQKNHHTYVDLRVLKCNLIAVLHTKKQVFLITDYDF